MDLEMFQIRLNGEAAAWVQERAGAEGLSVSAWLSQWVELEMRAERYGAAHARFREFDGVGTGSAEDRMSREEAHQR